MFCIELTEYPFKLNLLTRVDEARSDLMLCEALEQMCSQCQSYHAVISVSPLTSFMCDCKLHRVWRICSPINQFYRGRIYLNILLRLAHILFEVFE